MKACFNFELIVALIKQREKKVLWVRHFISLIFCRTKTIEVSYINFPVEYVFFWFLTHVVDSGLMLLLSLTNMSRLHVYYNDFKHNICVIPSTCFLLLSYTFDELYLRCSSVIHCLYSDVKRNCLQKDSKIRTRENTSTFWDVQNFLVYIVYIQKPADYLKIFFENVSFFKTVYRHLKNWASSSMSRKT